MYIHNLKQSKQSLLPQCKVCSLPRCDMVQFGKLAAVLRRTLLLHLAGRRVPQHWYLSTKLCGVIFHGTMVSVCTTVRISNAVTPFEHCMNHFNMKVTLHFSINICFIHIQTLSQTIHTYRKVVKFQSTFQDRNNTQNSYGS